MSLRPTSLLIWMFCLLTFATAGPAPLLAANEPGADKPPLTRVTEPQTVRMGFYEDGDYMGRDKNNEYVGFNIEFMHEVAKYSGWKYEIVECQTWEQALEMVEKGEIDVLPSVFKNEERTRQMLFTDQPLYYVYGTLNVRVNDTRYDFEDIDSFQGMTVGIVKGMLDARNFAAYCAEKKLSTFVIPYDDVPSVMRALANGTLDGVAISHLGRNSTFRSVAQFSPEAAYVAVSKKRPDLLAQLNMAINTRNTRNPNYLNSLYNKYLDVSAYQDPVFSKDELAYIRAADEITVLYDASWTPLTYRDPKTNAFSGVVANLFADIAKTTGLHFRFVPMAGSPLDNRQSFPPQTIVAAVNGDYQWTRQAKLNATQTYLRSPVIRVALDEASTTDIALQRGYLLSRKIAADHPKQRIRYYDSPSECFEALRRGDVQSTYVNAHVADYFLSSGSLDNLSLTTLSAYVDEQSIGVSVDADPRLFAILDKCLQYTTDEEMGEYVLKNTLRIHSVSWQRIVREHSVVIISLLTLFSMVVIGLLAGLLLLKSRTNRRIQKLLYKDDLTGLPNLNKFRIDAQTRIRTDKTSDYALIYVDIKQFKSINDTLGFDEGNRILRALADIFQNAVSEGELCARLSADHFVLLLRYTDWETIAARTAAMEKSLEDWGRANKRDYQLVLVFGVYVTTRGDSRDISLMLDFANYAKRSAGVPHKSVAVLYDEGMRQEGLLQRMLADRMRTALAEGEFVPLFQPKIDLITGRLVGCEALARWNFPGKGLLVPDRFLPFFEKNGFVTELDMHIYERVCQTQQEWMQAGLPLLPVSCNFSRLHFKNEAFPDTLTRIADTYGIPHQYLELEVTESVFFGNISQVQEHFLKLRRMGFPLAIDDFGSGYSSLGLLQQFTVDVMKLDRSFIEKGMHGDREQAVVLGAIQMAKALNMQVICEGVENPEQADVLRRMGCHVAQGFYYARPMPREEYELWLHKLTNQNN